LLIHIIAGNMIVNGNPKENKPQIDSNSPDLENGPAAIFSSLHPSHSDFLPLLDPSAPLPPSLDPHLSTVRLFWYLFWLCLAEVAYLGAMLVNYTWVTSQVVKYQNGREFSRSGEIPTLPWSFSLLFFSPSCLVLVVAVIMFLSQRYNFVIRKVFLGTVLVAILGSIAG
jgi:hypothetical protein